MSFSLFFSAGWTKNPDQDSRQSQREVDVQQLQNVRQNSPSDWLDNESYESSSHPSGVRASGVTGSSKAVPGKLNLSQFDNITDAVGRLSFNQKKPVKEMAGRLTASRTGSTDQLADDDHAVQVLFFTGISQ